jgi:hypothetical protein
MSLMQVMERRMARWNLVNNRACVPNIFSFGPHATAATLMATAAIPVLVIALFVPPSLVLPMLSIVAIVNSGVVALFAWCSGAEHSGDRITAWDVSGACAFIGFAAGTLSKPEHVVQFFALATTAQ